jgi:two-component system OmpR family response regulator
MIAADGVLPVRVTLFEPEPTSSARLACLLRAHGAQPLLMPDPAIAPRAWKDEAHEAILANPFRSRATPHAASAMFRDLAGDRAFLALTPDDLVEQRIIAMQAGADDAFAASGDPREMIARLSALLRRRTPSATMLACDDLTIDLIRRSVNRAGRDIAMPLREFDLLAWLARSADRVVTRHDLLRAVWRIDFDPGTNRIEVHMSRLRQRVDSGHDHAMLRTVKGSGYALVSRVGAMEMERIGQF